MRVDMTGGMDACWERSGAAAGEMGYPVLRGMGAHRVAFELFIGRIPKNYCVCHICDNPKCINPAHLFLGTHQDNMDDCTQKGRRYRKTTYAMVQTIRERISKGHRAVDIARDLGITGSYVTLIVQGKRCQGFR